MPTPLYILHEPESDPVQRIHARRYRKDVIRAGRWHLPDGQLFDVTPERMDRWIDTHKELTRAGIRVPLYPDHVRDSDRNMGFVRDLQREGDTLYAVVDVPREEDASRIGTTIQEVSISVDPAYRDGTGRAWGEVVRHIAPCTEPVVPGQDNFVPLAARRGDGSATELIVLRKESHMDWKAKVGKLLALAADTSDDDVFTALEAKLSAGGEHSKVLSQAKRERDQAVAKVQELTQKLQAAGAQPPNGAQPPSAGEPGAGAQPPPAVKPETPEVIELRQEIDRIVREGAQTRVAALEAAGKITPAMKPAVEALLCARQMSLRLGDEDSDVAKLAMTIFDNLPKGAALDLSERTKLFTETPNPNADEPDEAQLRERGRKSAAAVQGRKAD